MHTCYLVKLFCIVLTRGSNTVNFPRIKYRRQERDIGVEPGSEISIIQFAL